MGKADGLGLGRRGLAMIKEILQRRDLEILRTLARIRHATTRELTRTFFPSPIAARRPPSGS
jgi:hypothetical protein